MAVPPTAADLGEYLALTGASYPTDQLQEAIDSALVMQQDACVIEPYTPPLREAALRRAARLLAGRGAPLGAMDLGEFGSSPLVRWDAHIEEFEKNYRLGGFV